MRTAKRLTVLFLLVATIAGIAWGIVAWRQALIDRPLVLDESTKELRAIRNEIHARGSEEDLQRFRDWMAKNFVRGQATEADIRACFGRGFQNLDRPGRDRIRTLQFPLDGHGLFYLNLEFDPRTGILQAWEIYTNEVCGFCPHILANDGQWRLEGKMLAGRLGREREGSDTLLLPRLVPRNRRLCIRLANWAPEMEYLDQVQLGAVPCEPGRQVDMDGEGRIYVWKETRTVVIEPIREGSGRDGWTISLGEPGAGRVIVLEARNTSAFEKAMRKAVFTPGAPWPPANLALGFDNGGSHELQPVGTKFLRRIVVPIAPDARTLRISAPNNLWFVRRAWLGQGHVAQGVPGRPRPPGLA